ncbi:MAG: ABC transporter ATP-binding protein/permease, partial [Silvanigrellaceae bacterium]|nr:ABC transporter ATP-binding protein/permease [Silvanigrellaceae bacterium]
MSNSSIYTAVNKFRQLLLKKERLQWLSLIFVALCSSFLEVITASLIVALAQSLSKPGNAQNYLAKFGFHTEVPPNFIIIYIALICGLVYLIKNLVSAFEVYWQNKLIQQMNHNFKIRLLHKYSQSDYAFYLTRNSSMGFSVIREDTENMFSRGIISFAGILSEGFVFLGLISLVIYINPSLAFILLIAGIALYFIISKGLLPYFYIWGQKLQYCVLQSIQSLVLFFSAFKEITLLNKKNYFINSFEFHSQKRAEVQTLQNTFIVIPRIIIEVCFVAVFIVVICYMCLQQDTQTQMIGILGGYIYTGFRLLPGLNRIINHFAYFKSSIPSIERSYEEYFSSNLSHHKEQSVHDLKFENEIILKNLSFRYPNTKIDALRNINLRIKKGECIGIMGETGSGKSTLVDAILGLLTPYSGYIKLDDKYSLNNSLWRQKIGYVPQAIYLCDDSIIANIAFGESVEEIDLAKVQKAIENSQLNHLINKLSDGLNTLVGERGVRLSGGERQRIAIARALYRNPEVLIFDEATSALDNETETRLIKTIYSLSKNHTVIMIAHRLSTLESCDRIIHMQNGTIINELNYSQIQNYQK